MTVKRVLGVGLAALIAATGTPLIAAEESVGRGWPVLEPNARWVGAGGYYGASGNEAEGIPPTVAARGGAVPDGVTPLPVDLFTTTDFYADRELWSDPRYFRCNSSIGLESVYGASPGTLDFTGENYPQSAPWGYCDRDYPRESIVSPYPFETAQEHYEALLAETTARGGPVSYTAENRPPDWDGTYDRYPLSPTSGEVREMQRGAGPTWEPDFRGMPPWFYMDLNQVPTILSLLTPDYQTRFVQQAYHNAVTNAPHWPAQYCWPEGLMRFWSGQGTTLIDLIVTPQQVTQISGWGGILLRQAQIGRTFNTEGAVPRLGQDVPAWYGETIGFWDTDALITWTSNVQGWMNHGSFEFSNQMQVVEIYTPRQAETGEFQGLRHEAIFYDAEALVEPVRIVRDLDRIKGLGEGDPFVFIGCLPTYFPVNGRAEAVTPGATFEYFMPDWYGRPWGQLWERYFEDGMTRPEASQLFGF